MLAADAAERLDAVAANSKLKHMALELLKAAAKTLDAEAQGDGEEPRETAAALLARFRSAQDDTAFRVRQREIKEQEARDAVAAAEGLDGTGEAWRKESAAEYQAVRPNAPAASSTTQGQQIRPAQPRVFVPQRRAKLVLLEKIDRGEVKGDSVRKYTAEEASEVLDDQLAHSQKHTAMAYRGGRAL